MQANTKTRERTEGAAETVQAMHGDSCFPNRVDPDSMCSTSFGDDSTRPPALPCSWEDALVDNGAAAPKSCLTLRDALTNSRRWLAPRRHGHYNDEDYLLALPFWFCPTEDTNLTTSILHVSYFSSFGWTNNQQAPFWPRVIKTKSGQNRMFDPGDYQGRLRACPVLGTWRALFFGEFLSFWSGW